MAERDPAKLAAARKKLKEYQQRSRENTPVVPPQQQHLLSTTEVSLPSNREDVRKNDGSVQNYVYDSGTASVKSEKLPSTELPESLFMKDNHFNNNNNNNNSILNGSIETNSSVNTRNIFNGNCEKPNEHYVEQLVTELNTQSLFTDNNSSNNSNIFGGSNNNNNNLTSDIQSAKDFFDSLPVSSQSSVDFSFDAQIASDTPPVAISNPTVNTEVPSTGILTGLDINVKNLNQDSQSDHSESVPLTPSEQDKSDISSSSVGQSPKQISQVLELQLKEIDTKLGVEINKNRILTEQLQVSRDHISQLEDSLEVCRKETEAKVAALEEKLQLHVKTLEILVSEKTELQTTLTACQESISQKAGEIEELQSRLRASRHRVGDLERELGLAQALRQQQEKAAHEATCSRDVLKNEVDLMRKHLDESTEEVLDLKHKLEEKVREVSSLNDELKEKESQLSVSQLRIEQLSSPGDGSDGLSNSQDVIVSLQKDKQNLEQQIEQLNKNFKKVMSEHDEASSQYQQYVTTLNSQLQTMAAKYENVCNQRDNLSAREASLVEHIASLEKQMQQSLTRKPSPPPVVTPFQQQNAEFQQVKQQLEKVTEERKQFEDEMNSQVELNNKLTETLEEYTGRVLELERTIERLEADRPDAGLLQAAIESDKVAASRAIAQNTDLKKQLEELQDAFIKLSNSKLELTEKLELEHAQCKELTKQLAEMNSKVESDSSNVSNGCINDNEQLDQEDGELINGVEKVDFCSQTYNVKDPDFSNITIDVEAMTKLEDKFKRKMLEVAELSDEKQRLEHLVLQLQGETETIGEYITLYQIQRGMLRQRAQEKDEQMARLSQEREVLRNKLNELNHLVQTLLPDSYNHCYEAARLGHENGDHNQVDLDHATEVTETQCPHNSEGTTNETIDSSPVHKHKPIEVNKEETAGKIRALLTEIGSSKLVTADGETTPNFHHCPWCSGQLITV